MIITENWAIDRNRAENFLSTQAEAFGNGCFQYGSCRICVRDAEDSYVGNYAISRILITFEGDEDDLKEIQSKFRVQFLSAGG